MFHKLVLFHFVAAWKLGISVIRIHRVAHTSVNLNDIKYLVICIRICKFIILCPLRKFRASLYRLQMLVHVGMWVYNKLLQSITSECFTPTDFTLGTLIIIDLPIIPSSRVIWTLLSKGHCQDHKQILTIKRPKLQQQNRESTEGY